MRCLAGTILILFGQLAGAGGFQVGSGISGSWFDPSHDGEGWKIEITDANTAVIYWFTYPPEGSDRGDQAWMVAVALIEGDRIIADDVIITRGARFGDSFDPDDVIREDWGTFTMTFSGLDAGTMSYDGSPVGFGTGDFELTRLTRIHTPAPDDPASAGVGISGSWFDPLRDGEGWLFEVIGANSALVYWFTYDENGNQAWNIGVGRLVGNLLVVREPLETEGTIFGPDFDPDALVRSKWGTVVYTFEDCAKGRATYANQKGLGFGESDLSRLTSLAGVNCTPFDPAEKAAVKSASNTGDPLVVEAERSDGVSIEYFGRKSSVGDFDPDDNTALVVDPFDRVASLQADDQGRLTRIEDSETGNSLKFDYPEQGGPVVVTGLARAGRLQTVAELTTIAAKNGEEDEQRTSRAPSSPSGAANSKAAESSLVLVERCGVPINQSSVKAAVSVGDEEIELSAIAQGNGMYEIRYPTTATAGTEATAQSSCDSFATETEASCSAVDGIDRHEIPGICRGLAESLADKIPPGSDLDTHLENVAQFFDSCVHLLQAAKLACDSAGGVRPDARSDEVCTDSSVVDRAFDQIAPTMDIQFFATNAGGTYDYIGLVIIDENFETVSREVVPLFSTDVTDVPTAGPFPDVVLNNGSVLGLPPGIPNPFGPSPAIADFFVEPLNPRPDQEYTAVVQVACATSNPFGNNVSISVEGSDGTSNSDSCSIRDSGECRFVIPAGAMRESDTITVDLEDGPVRQIQIVF